MGHVSSLGLSQTDNIAHPVKPWTSFIKNMLKDLYIEMTDNAIFSNTEQNYMKYIVTNRIMCNENVVCCLDLGFV